MVYDNLTQSSRLTTKVIHRLVAVRPAPLWVRFFVKSVETGTDIKYVSMFHGGGKQLKN